MWTVYILRSLRDGRLYVGYTGNLGNRLKSHARGETHSLRARLPFRVIHTEVYATYHEARRRERFLKSGKGRLEIRKSILPASVSPSADYGEA